LLHHIDAGLHLAALRVPASHKVCKFKLKVVSVLKAIITIGAASARNYGKILP
jgi:hypothetical protein